MRGMIRATSFLFLTSGTVFSGAAFPAFADATVETRLLPAPRVTVSDGENWGFNTRGRFEMDFIGIHNDKGNHHGGMQDRRTRIGLEGFYGNWSSVVEFDLTDQDEGNYHNVMVQYDNQKHHRLRMGYFKEYFGMERLDSSGSTMYLERAAIETFTPQRNTGAQYTYYNDTSSATLGVFTDGFVHNPRKDKVGVTTRLTHAFYFDDRNMLHLGGAASVRKMDEVGFSARPDTAATVKVIDTGRMLDADDMYQGGLELGWAWQNLLLEGEYMMTQVERENNPTARFDGWYVSAAWMLTGEQHEYHANDDAVFSAVKPYRPFNLKTGDLGAWEVMARYQEIDLNSANVQGGEMRVITGGVNWHPNAQWQVIADVSLVNTDAHALDANDSPVVYGMRIRTRF